MDTGQRIAQKRKELGLSQEALGEQLGVSRQAIYTCESGAAQPEIEKLVALSRIFSVSVGWLLGVEEQPSAPPEDRELTGDQLRMVQEIVDRYVAAQEGREAAPPPARRRWPAVLLTAAVLAVAIALISLFSRLDQVTADYQNLQSAISQIDNSVSGQISAITSQVEEILKGQNQLTAEYGTEILSYDLREGTVTFRVWATPKTYTEGMTAYFMAQSGNHAARADGALNGSRQFMADITCGLTDDITLSVVFDNGQAQETQVLEQYGYLRSETFPQVSVMGDLWGSVDGGELLAGDTIHVRIDEPELGDAQIRSIQVGLFCEQILVMWYDQLEGQPDSYVGDWPEDALYFQRPEAVTMKEGPVYCEAAVVTDQYGRQWVAWDSPVAYDAERGSMAFTDADYSSGLSDWDLG